MQRVTNCILMDGDRVLLLQKPRRGWWVAPGGKMEPEESVLESVKREYYEETSIRIKKPELFGVFTIIVQDGNTVVDEWMLFTFKATQYEGESIVHSPEGTLQWFSKDDVAELPMAQGDRFIFQHLLYETTPMYGTFYYTQDYSLLSYRLHPEPTE